MCDGSKAVTWQGYARDKLRRNFLELFIPSKHKENKGKQNFSQGTRRLRSSLMLRYSSPATGVIWALRAQSPKKSANGFPGPLGPGGRKSRKRVEKEPKIDYFLDFLDSFSTLFRLFRPPGPRGAGNPFSDVFLDFGPEGPK